MFNPLPHFIVYHSLVLYYCILLYVSVCIFHVYILQLRDVTHCLYIQLHCLVTARHNKRIYIAVTVTKLF